jgi:hypothetical protein
VSAGIYNRIFWARKKTNIENDTDDEISVSDKYVSGFKAVLSAVESLRGATRSEIGKFVLEKFHRRLGNNTISTYLNRYSQEGQILYQNGRWYAVHQQGEVDV